MWRCLTKVSEHKRKKLGLKTVDAIFLGYMETSYVYRFLVIRSNVSCINVNTIVEFRDATLFKHVFLMKTGVLQSVSLIDSTSTTGSIPDYVERIAHVGVNLMVLFLDHISLWK